MVLSQRMGFELPESIVRYRHEVLARGLERMEPAPAAAIQYSDVDEVDYRMLGAMGMTVVTRIRVRIYCDDQARSWLLTVPELHTVGDGQQPP